MVALVLRPKEKMARTAKALQQAHVSGVCVALMQTRPVTTHPKLPVQQGLHCIVVTSTAAAEIAAQYYPDVLGQHLCISVGKSTASVLAEAGINSVLPEQNDSEGILQMTTLLIPPEEVGATRHVIIFKGEGGRHLLANTLENRGFVPHECNLYSREVLPQPVSSASWRPGDIDIVVATSGEQIALAFKAFEAQWLTSRTWVTVSQRTADIAIKFGVQQLAVSNGASDNALITTLHTLMEQ